MRKMLLLFVFFVSCAFVAFSQERPRLGILPFTGGANGDGETIATLFSLQNDIQSAFTVVPRTSAVNALVAEQNFQLTGYTDSDTIARLGRLLNADFVVSGHIRRLGNRNLVITTIVNVETFEQMAGDYRTYRKIEDVRRLLPAISRNMIAASRKETTGLPRLAIAPFNIANIGVDIQDAETLAQILAIEIINTGVYSVLPRTTTMQAAMQELEFQMAGHTAEEEAKALGQAVNADFVLSAEARSLGNINMFTAQILHVEDGSLLTGNTLDYQVVADGITLMAELALLLTDPENAVERITYLNRQRSRAIRFGDPAKFWSLGASAGTSLADPWLTTTIRGTLAPLRFFFFELGCDVGFITGVENANYYSIYPFANLAMFFPFANKGGWYIGTGGGFMMAEYSIDDYSRSKRYPAANFTIGFNIGNLFDISYTLRTNFNSASNKIAVGFSHRFTE
ncbi:MAG: penicillin-binding protein activator LpoB [Treponema sp.]|nr:penicillin-binding protein activator LpoB [Treponema sp.]